MLLETKLGPPNVVTRPQATTGALHSHEWTRENGYQPKAYAHQEFPRMLFRPRQPAANLAIELLTTILAIEDKDDRQTAYIRALEALGNLGHDIRQFPLTAPDNNSLKSLATVLSIQVRNNEMQEWLSKNPGKTPGDFQLWLKSPETAEVTSAETMEELGEGWFLTPACKETAVIEDAPKPRRRA